MKIYISPTHHWDPFWTFPHNISEKMGVRNLRRALDIIKENPDFKYVIGQVYLWELFKKHFPDRIDELKQRVKEGKIILACGGYANPDFNLPSGESLIRQLSFGKRAWQKEFGVNAEAVWIQDSFGQSAQLPQIFSKAGLKFHTAKRGAKKDLPAVFVWEASDGSKVFFDRQPLGHHGIIFMPSFALPAFSAFPNRIKPWEKLEKILAFPPVFWLLALAAIYLPDVNLWSATKGSFWKFKSALNYLNKLYPEGKIFIPHGFGFDGALPQGYIAKLAKLYSLISKDKVSISSPSEFLAEAKKENLLVVKGELNGPNRKSGEAYGTLPGTSSARIDVKQRARIMERRLYLTEFLETLKYLRGGKYRDFTEIWKLKFLNDFHDGICGSSNDNNYNLLKEKGESLISQCRNIISSSLKEMAPEKAVFNPLPWPRKDLIEHDKKIELVEAGPAGFSAITASKPERGLGFNAETKVLFSPFYRVGWGNGNLEIYQLIPRDSDKKIGPKITGEKFARFRLQNENGDTYFWDVSQKPEDWLWDEIQSVKIVECNEFRATLEIKSGFPGLEISQRIKLYAHTPRIDFETKAENRKKNIRLQIHLPVISNAVGEISREIPAGFLKEGESEGQSKWRDIFGEKFAYYDNIKCAQNWIYLSGAAVYNDGLPEHELSKNGCFLTLLRGVGRIGTKGRGLFNKFQPENVPWKAGSPHPIPLAQMQGSHEFKYAFYPGKREDIVRACYEFLFPLEFCNGQGKIKDFHLFSVSDKNVIPLAVKKAETKEAVVIRLLETEGKEKEIEINLNPEINLVKAALTDLMEENISHLTIKNSAVKLRMKPQEIATIMLEK